MDLTNEALSVADRLTRKWEGCHLQAYPDPATGGAPWTIGWGSTGPDVRKGVVWTQKQADDRHLRDLENFMIGVQAAIKRPATANQLGAMTSLAYNIGISAFRGSTLVKLFNAGDAKGAAEQFLRWNKANGKVMKGLSNRRADERREFLS